MPTGRCDKPGCSVLVDGLCLEMHADPNECPHFHRLQSEQLSVEQPLDRQQSSVVLRAFHTGGELGSQDAAELMRSRYVHLVAVLGATDVGKTCLLSSLYLMALHGDMMPDYVFAGSLTLQGFEDRVRQLREWEDGALPTMLSEHTRLQDPRSAAFLHLALKEKNGRRLELLLTDLPGEWTEDLVKRASAAERFSFLHRADGIILVIDGPSLATDTTRHVEVIRAKLVLQRLVQDVRIDTSTPLALLVSKADLLERNVDAEGKQLLDFAIGLGFTPQFLAAAAFSSRRDEVRSGHNVLNALKHVINDVEHPVALAPWAFRSTSSRSFTRFTITP